MQLWTRSYFGESCGEVSRVARMDEDHEAEGRWPKTGVRLGKPSAPCELVVLRWQLRGGDTRAGRMQRHRIQQANEGASAGGDSCAGPRICARTASLSRAHRLSDFLVRHPAAHRHPDR